TRPLAARTSASRGPMPFTYCTRVDGSSIVSDVSSRGGGEAGGFVKGPGSPWYKHGSYQGIALAIPQVLETNRPFRGCASNIEFFRSLFRRSSRALEFHHRLFGRPPKHQIGRAARYTHQ